MPKDNTKKKKRDFPLSDAGIDMVSGGVSALAALSTHPLDTLAVKSQSGGGGLENLIKAEAKANPGGKVSWSDLKKGLAKSDDVASKWKSLWKGVGPKAMKAVPATIIGFTTFEGTKRGLKAWRNDYENSDKKKKLLDSAKDAVEKKIDLEKNSEYKRLIEEYPMEKDAFIGAALKFIPKAVKGLGSFAKSFGKAGGNFAKGFTGVGKMNFKNPGYSAGIAAAFTAPRKFTKSKALKNYGKYAPKTKVKGNFNINTSRTNTIR